MNETHVRDRRILHQQALDVLRGSGDVVGRLERRCPAAHHLGEPRHEQFSAAKAAVVAKGILRELEQRMHRATKPSRPGKKR